MKLFLIFLIMVGVSSGDQLESILLHQRDTGGWPKNRDYKAKFDRKKLLKDKGKKDSTFDNGATTLEMRILAKEFRKSGDQEYREAFMNGLRFCLDAQYENGGWPQIYPDAKGYHAHITFNDHAMIKVMELLRDVATEEDFGFVDEGLRQKSGKAVARGLECILECQIVLDGELTVWCAQHDAKTHQPAKARSYELPSFSGNESVGIVRYLMSIESPTDDVKEAIEGAVKWFRGHQLEGYRLEKKEGDYPKGYDQVMVRDKEAEPLWARFYDLKEAKPIYCSRDGIPKRKLSEISYERRNGYSWVGTYPKSLLSRDYPNWKARQK